MKSILTLLLCFALASALHAATATQTLSLDAGWNAVWLEVEPTTAGNLHAPETVFSSLAIQTVAAFFPRSGAIEFVRDPDEEPFNEDTWLVWYREDPAGRNSLAGVRGNQAYLIKTSSAVTLDVTGEASFYRHDWVPDSYNFTGFGLIDGSEPTFASFFEPSATKHPINRLFRLQSGNWVGVRPDDTMKAGEAYWVFCQGSSKYQGPFLVDVPGIDGLDYGSQFDDEELLFFNETSTPLSVTIARHNLDNPANALNLLHLNKDPNAENETETVSIVTYSTPAIASKRSLVETLRLDRTTLAGAGMGEAAEQLYRLESAATGTRFWLPVSGRNPGDATELGRHASTAGLWVGEVLLDSVTRGASSDLEEAPLAPKVRVLLHADDTGTVKLLKAATLMRERSAEDEAIGEDVVVIDDAKLRFFEGVETRRGKRIGRRIETAFYDMPLEGGNYALSVDATGTIDPGGRIDVSLTLGESHRTNPFRHGIHPEHRFGYEITRAMSIAFDLAESPDAQRARNYGQEVLVGTFTETVTGLRKASESITTSGRCVFHRVSTSNTLY